MKIRNKKTGRIDELADIRQYWREKEDGGMGYKLSTRDGMECIYNSLAELYEEWGDYKPKEPLIKDEKTRKAVRAWAEACGLTHATYKLASNEFYDADTRGAFAIKFTHIPLAVYLEDGESFTIAELCGEEEKECSD